MQGHGSQESKQAAAATQRGSVQSAQESHEESHLASTMYWIDYPMPFLSFYYDTFPAVDDGLAGAAEVASLARAGGNDFNDSASNGCASSASVTH